MTSNFIHICQVFFLKFYSKGLVQPYGVKKKKLNFALWGKSIKLGTVIVLVVLIIFSYGPHSNMRGGRHIVSLGRGVMAFLSRSGRVKKGKKAV